MKESGDWKVLYGADIDNNSKLNEHGIETLLDAAQQYNDCLVLVGHQINNTTIKLQVSRERLIMLSKAAAERKLRFVTVNQIAK